VNGEVHGGRPRPTGAVVPRGKKKRGLVNRWVNCVEKDADYIEKWRLASFKCSKSDWDSLSVDYEK
jgi:hypothetical protein